MSLIGGLTIEGSLKMEGSYITGATTMLGLSNEHILVHRAEYFFY